jgi:hypothetical protein
MKKTLVALAVLAATGASFAQVSITGTLSMGYKATRDSFGNDASGLGVDTTNPALTFTAKEDLGGGQQVVASLGFATANRGGALGGDSKLTYTNNSFGQVELGSAKDNDVFSSIAYGGANLITFDGKLNQIETSSDYISYAAPIGPVIFVFKHAEAGNSITGAAGGLGIGAGTQGDTSTTSQGTNTVALVYKQDALSLVGAYLSYTNRNDSGNFSDGNSLTKSDVVHLEGGYDFGFVKVGAGADHVNAAWGVTQDNLIAGFSVPAGAWTFGAAWESSKVDGVTSAPLTAFHAIPGVATVVKGLLSKTEGTATGTTFGAQYNFSKRTNVAFRYATWTRSGFEQLEAYKLNGGNPTGVPQLGYKQNETQTDILLTHNF